MSNMNRKPDASARRGKSKQPKPPAPTRTRRSPAITQANRAKRIEREAKRQAQVEAKHATREFDGKPVPRHGNPYTPAKLITPQFNLAFYAKLRAIKAQARKVAAVRVRKDTDASMFALGERVASLHPETLENLK